VKINVTTVINNSCFLPYSRSVVKVSIWGPGTLEKIGALLEAEMASPNLLVPIMAVRGLGTLANNF